MADKGEKTEEPAGGETAAPAETDGAPETDEAAAAGEKPAEDEQPVEGGDQPPEGEQPPAEGEQPAEGESPEPENKPPEEQSFEPPIEEEPEPEESVQECPSEIESQDSVNREIARICDPSLKQNFRDYSVLVKEIKTQNSIILKIKSDIQKLCCKGRLTKCDKRDIRALRSCFAEENEKLTCLLQKAIDLQSNDPNRRFKDINLETSLEEDMMVIKGITSRRSGRGNYDSSEDGYQTKNTSSDIKRLQEALNRLQKSIEIIKEQMKTLRDRKEDEEEARERKTERFKSACAILKNIEGGEETKSPIEVDEGSCGDHDDSERLQCIINQQSNLLEEYSLKYVKVQQKVSEQVDIIQKLENKSKLMEDEINNEVDKVKSKFMEKINDLADYPTILENERKKIAQTSKDKELMECKLRTLCKQLRKMKSQKYEQEEHYNYEKTDPNIMEAQREELKQCKNAHYRLLGEIEKVKDEKEKLAAEHDTAILDLESLRCESAKNISKEKGLSGCIRKTFEDLVKKTENELAQCKATSCLAVAERDETIKEMRKQMNTLAFSFDAAQKEIQCLKHKIFTLAKDSSKPVQCDV